MDPSSPPWPPIPHPQIEMQMNAISDTETVMQLCWASQKIFLKENKMKIRVRIGKFRGNVFSFISKI
uniref:Ovule protein n=1 Tax=Meloidogyne incognita TaxID=6306 RepID=A0A914L1I2_MELIC